MWLEWNIIFLVCKYRQNMIALPPECQCFEVETNNSVYRYSLLIFRTDDQKYANMNKTVSRKQQAKTQNKKTTKLRHT